MMIVEGRLLCLSDLTSSGTPTITLLYLLQPLSVVAVQPTLTLGRDVFWWRSVTRFENNQDLPNSDWLWTQLAASKESRHETF